MQTSALALEQEGINILLKDWILTIRNRTKCSIQNVMRQTLQKVLGKHNNKLSPGQSLLATLSLSTLVYSKILGKLFLFGKQQNSELYKICVEKVLKCSQKQSKIMQHAEERTALFNTY